MVAGGGTTTCVGSSSVLVARGRLPSCSHDYMVAIAMRRAVYVCWLELRRRASRQEAGADPRGGINAAFPRLYCALYSRHIIKRHLPFTEGICTFHVNITFLVINNYKHWGKNNYSACVKIINIKNFNHIRQRKNYNFLNSIYFFFFNYVWHRTNSI